MAENKKSFLLYCDYIDLIKKLPDDKAGQLFKIIMDYVNDNNPKVEDMLLDIAFEPIKKQLKRDLSKYEDIKKKRSEAGKRSAAKRAEANSTSVESDEQSSTNPTVTDTDNVNVTVTVTDNDIKEIYSLYPSKCPIKNSSTGKTTKNKDKIKSLLKNISADELKSTINRYISECKGSKTYIKNFGTFLNNIPDYSDEEEIPKETLYNYFAEGYGMRKKRTKQEMERDRMLCQGKISQITEIKP